MENWHGFLSANTVNSTLSRGFESPTEIFTQALDSLPLYLLFAFFCLTGNILFANNPCDDKAAYSITSVSSSSPDNCPFLENGTIEIFTSGSDWEYSIDAGFTYQSWNSFDGLEDGSYTVQIRNTVTSAVLVYSSNPVVLTDPACADPCASCHELFSLDWYDGSTGAIWAITNGEVSVDQTNTVSEPKGTVDIDISLENPDGQVIDFSNCGTAGNHFYTATCNAVGATNDCDGDPMTSDGQFSYGCSYLTMGMTANNSSETASFVFDFDKPVQICDLQISDIDYEGSGGGNPDSWQDEVDVSASLDGTGVNVNVAVGSAVYVTNNNTPNVNLLSGFSTWGGGLAPTDLAGTALISTTTYIDKLTITYSNGPADDGESDDHAIRISSIVFCPMLPELCSDGLDNDGDGDTDCVDVECPSGNAATRIN